MSVISLPLAGEVVNRFIALLHKHSITPPGGSRIESDLLSVTELLSLPTNLSRNLHAGLRAQGGGMYDLAAKLLAVELQPEFESFIPHLKLFASNVPFASVTQAGPAADTDDVHRRLTELYFGSLAIHIGTNVVLDHPKDSRGDNPDVLFDATQADGVKRRWALAVKSVSTRSGQTLFENIEKASQQINSQSCIADRGIVVIHIQGSLDHLALWSQRFDTEEMAIRAVNEQIVALAKKAGANRPPSEWQDILSGRTSPVVLYMAHAVVELRAADGSGIPTILKVLCRDYPLGYSDNATEWIVCHLNYYMQTVLKGIPGAKDQEPR